MTGTTFTLPIETWREVYARCNDEQMRQVIQQCVSSGTLSIWFPDDKAAIVSELISTWDWAAEGWD